MNTWLASFVSALGWALVHFVWQGTLVGIAAAFALMLLRSAGPQTRYLVGCAALALCLLLPVVGVWTGLHADVSFVGTATAAPSSADTVQFFASGQDIVSTASWRASLQGRLPWLVAMWSLGAGLLAARMALGLMWVGRIGRAQSGTTHPRWQARVDRLADAFGIQRAIGLRVVDSLDSPVATGWWRPIVLVPAALIANMPFELLEALLAHELAHIKRHDYIVNLAQCAVEALLFYHPVVWWLSKQIRIEREQIADDLAAQVLGEPRQLALALQQLELFQASQARIDQPSSTTRLVPAANGGHLMSRIPRLIRPNQHALSWKMALPIIGLTAICLTVSAHDHPSVVQPVVATTATSVVPVLATARTATTMATPAVVATAPETSVVPVIASVLATNTSASAGNPARPEAGAAHKGARMIHTSDRSNDAYAVVRAGQDGMNMSGDSRDIPAVERARQKVHGDFIWVRRGSKAYVVEDPTVVAQVLTALQPVEALGKQMEAMGAQMDGPSKHMEALGKQMESLSSSNNPHNAAMERTSAQMEALGHQQQALGNRMEALGNKMEQARDDATREALDRQMQALDAQMKPLEQQMDKLSASMDEHSKGMEAAQEPMEELSRQMEEQSKPMEVLGKQMEALGKQEEQLSKQADLKVKVLIDEAMKGGKVQSTDILR